MGSLQGGCWDWERNLVAECSPGLSRYRSKFPELESLVLHPIDYARVIKAIANEMVRQAAAPRAGIAAAPGRQPLVTAAAALVQRGFKCPHQLRASREWACAGFRPGT